MSFFVRNELKSFFVKKNGPKSFFVSIRPMLFFVKSILKSFFTNESRFWRFVVSYIQTFTSNSKYLDYSYREWAMLFYGKYFYWAYIFRVLNDS